MKTAILTSPNQWFVSYAKEFVKIANHIELFYKHEDIPSDIKIVFILSYHRIIEESYLSIHKHNIVIHASLLPEGKGWAPMFWQILEGKDEIPFTMFEASNGVDNGDIYFVKNLVLTGYELNVELRNKQALFILEMCNEFLLKYENYRIPRKQIGIETFYDKRGASESELDIHKTINEQFNLLRIANNKDYPAFFFIGDKKYILEINEVLDEDR